MPTYVSIYMRGRGSWEVVDEEEDLIIVLCPSADSRVVWDLLRGDLLTGYSKVVRLGPGLLYAGGSTIAAHVVERVGIAVIVERAQEGDDHWTYYDSWQKFNENIDKVSDNRRLVVEGDYYYRVRCTHSANDDMSSSFTNGVFIEEPQILPGIPEIGED